MQQGLKLFCALGRHIIITHGVEIWGGRSYKELEAIQERYIKWTLKLNKYTPDYLVRAETKEEKVEVNTGTRTMKYEEKLRFLKMDTL